MSARFKKVQYDLTIGILFCHFVIFYADWPQKKYQTHFCDWIYKRLEISLMLIKLSIMFKIMLTKRLVSWM